MIVFAEGQMKRGLIVAVFLAAASVVAATVSAGDVTYNGQICKVENQFQSLRRIDFTNGQAINISPNTLAVVCPVPVESGAGTVDFTVNVANFASDSREVACRAFEYLENGARNGVDAVTVRLDSATYQLATVRLTLDNSTTNRVALKCFLSEGTVIQTVRVQTPSDTGSGNSSGSGLPPFSCTSADMEGTWRFSIGDAVNNTWIACSITFNRSGSVTGGSCREADGPGISVTSGRFNVRSDCTVSGELNATPTSYFLDAGTFSRDKLLLHGGGEDRFGQRGVFTATRAN